MSSLIETKITNMYIEKSDYNESFFNEVKFNNVEFYDVHFNDSEIYSTSLKDIDLSSCEFENTKFDLYSVKGMIIDDFQASNLMPLLGVKIRR